MTCPNHDIDTILVVQIETTNINDVEVTLNSKELVGQVTGSPPNYEITISANQIDEVGTLNIKEGSTVLACRTIVKP